MKLQLSDIAKGYGGQQVLSRVDFQVKGREKIGLVGRNGCGKTTLLKILSGVEEADDGLRIVPRETRVGSLDQITFEDLEKTAKEALLEVFADVMELEGRLEEQGRLLESDHSEKQLEKYDRLLSEFEARGGYGYEAELKAVFGHFGFGPEDLDRPLKEFSSGQRTRIGLVKLLLSRPDVLLLDEPTNHLDLEAIEWLEGYVKRYPGAVVVVSHDRMFLDHVADEIVEIEFGRVQVWPGDYSHFVQAKKAWLEKNHEAYVRQQQEIARMEALIERFRYKAGKAAFAQSKVKQLEKMERIQDARSDDARIRARFQSGRPGGRRVLETENLQSGYDEVLSTLTLTVMRGDRVGIIGSNGAGKSTLVKTLTGKLAPLGGIMKWGHQVDVGHFSQDAVQEGGSGTVIDALWEHSPDATQTEIRNTLAAFLFTQDEVFKEVSTLSGGERVRLALAQLMEDHDNVLVLDEPTNHLDIPAREALEDALEAYDGTVLFVSHDRMFLKKMAGRIVDLQPGRTVVYEGSWEEYISGRVPQEKAGMQKEPKKAETKQAFADLKQVKNRVARLEQLIEDKEAELEALRELRYEPEYYQDYRKMEELDGQIDDVHNELAALTGEWEEKMAMLE